MTDTIKINAAVGSFFNLVGRLRDSGNGIADSDRTLDQVILNAFDKLEHLDKISVLVIAANQSGLVKLEQVIHNERQSIEEANAYEMLALKSWVVKASCYMLGVFSLIFVGGVVWIGGFSKLDVVWEAFDFVSKIVSLIVFGK